MGAMGGQTFEWGTEAWPPLEQPVMKLKAGYSAVTDRCSMV